MFALAATAPTCKVDYQITIELMPGQPLDGTFIYFYRDQNFTIDHFNQIGPGQYRAKIKNVTGPEPGDVIGIRGWFFAPTGSEKVTIEMKVKGCGPVQKYEGQCPMNPSGFANI